MHTTTTRTDYTYAYTDPETGRETIEEYVTVGDGSREAVQAYIDVSVERYAERRDAYRIVTRKVTTIKDAWTSV